MILATQGDETERWEARQYLEDQEVGTAEGIFWNTECISATAITILDSLHPAYLGILKQLMDWVTSFLEQHSRIDSFNQLWVVMPTYHGFAPLNKPYSQVMQWSGKEIKALRHIIVPIFVATLLNPSASQRIPSIQALLYVCNFMYFHLMARYQYHTEATIEYMENYLEEFHCQKDVFSRFHTSKATKMVSEALKSNILWTNRRNWTVTPHGPIFQRLQKVVALMKIKCISSLKLHKILLTNRISTLWKYISRTTSLTISASLGTS